jgi:hypothetical protein
MPAALVVGFRMQYVVIGRAGKRESMDSQSSADLSRSTPCENRVPAFDGFQPLHNDLSLVAHLAFGGGIPEVPL